jgi:polysaccharide pyruvyl transferase WcaK-like protein
MKLNPHYFILGYFGWFNAGDDAIGLSIITELSKKCPDASFSFTSNDRYYLDNFKEIKIPCNLKMIGFKASNILYEIAKSDYFIIAGGTHFHDEGKSKYGRFKVLLAFAILSCYAKVVNKPPMLFGHGIGPLSSIWSRSLVKVILYNSKIAYVRDKDSVEVVTSLGFSEKCVHSFDCTAILIGAGSVHNNDLKIDHSRQRVIGISLLPFYGIYSGDGSRDVELMNSLAKCLESIVKYDSSIILHLFAFRTGTRHSDVSILKYLSDSINIRPDAIKIIEYYGNVEKFLNSIEECDFFIGMRYHASVFAYLFHKPQIILDYMGKCRNFGKDILIDETAIIPIADIFIPEFCYRIQSFLSDPDQCIAHLPIDSARERASKMFEMMRDTL